MKFNINEEVQVTLTPYGRKLMVDQKLAFSEKAKLKFDISDSEYFTERERAGKFQLWRLMRVFGPYLCNGGDSPFEAEIDLLVD